MKKRENSADKIKKMKEILNIDISFKPKKKKVKFSVTEVFFLLTVTAVVSMMAGMIIVPLTQSNSVPTENVYDSEEFEDFVENYNYIRDNYLGEMSEKEALKAALNGILEATGDPFSVFMDKTETDNFNFSLTGSFTGLGVQIQKSDDNKLKVVSVFENSPAKKAGIKVGQIIKSIDGVTTEDRSATDFVRLVMESATDTVLLEIVDGDSTFNISVTKGYVEIPSVFSEVLDNEIGYIDIDIFALNTGYQFIEHYDNLKSKGIKSLIIDFRGNGGGHLRVADDMLSHLFDSSYVIYQTSNKEETRKIYSSGAETTDMEIVILMDHDSASASEIMIGALRENLNVKLVGVVTYGKGTVQEVKELPNGTQIKLTTNKWLTPKGNWINETGFIPDLEVYVSEEYMTDPIRENDNQLKAAIDLILEK